MNQKVSSSIKYFGTDQPVPKVKTFTCGALVCEFDQGAIRHIRVAGKEVVRNVAFVARDQNWGTCEAKLSDLQVNQARDAFDIKFAMEFENDGSILNCEAEIKARLTDESSLELLFQACFRAQNAFTTNRTGFVVLHPVAGVAGEPVTVEHVDGADTNAMFPKLIDPSQPFKNIRTIKHTVAENIAIECKFLGDIFEMEDHRQWNDASFKTYVRPLSLPWPYTLNASEEHFQSVCLKVTLLKPEIVNNTTRDHDSASIADQSVESEATLYCEKNDAGQSISIPDIGLGLEPQHIDSALFHVDTLSSLNVRQLAIWHHIGEHTATDLERAVTLAHQVHAEVFMQAVIPDDDYKSEIAELASQCEQAKVQPVAICVSPEIYLTSLLPGNDWPNVTPLEKIYDTVRHYFPNALIGGGMLAYFPEINRHRPPVAHLDFITHTSNVITHACDDVTVIENLEALPFIFETCRSFSGNKPYWLGPSSIGMRFNPYGSSTIANPDNKRVAMTRLEPRQRGLINAAWTLAYVAHATRYGVSTVSLHAPTGEFGLIYHPESWSQPGFDGQDRLVFPAYHVVKGLAEASGKPSLNMVSSDSQTVEVLGYKDGDYSVIWLANLHAHSTHVHCEYLKGRTVAICSMTLDTWEEATRDSRFTNRVDTCVVAGAIELPAYAVLKITAKL